MKEAPQTPVWPATAMNHSKALYPPRSGKGKNESSYLGVTTDLTELISLRRHAQMLSYRPKGRAPSAGNNLSKLRGRGMDFAEVRNYQAGDEIRHMEWRVTARTGRPHIKLYQEAG